MSATKKVAVLGCGVIGASWAALFLATGREVFAHDPHPDAHAKLTAAIATCWSALRALGMTELETPPKVQFCANPAQAVRDADFVQESVPEQLAIKHALYADIEPHLSARAIVASSASGLMLSEMQRGWQNPARFILGHPFNPPHLIPLVELLGNERTAAGVLESAESFYQSAGKVTIRVQREVPGHVANRLQAALWREAVHLVQSGVASVADVDKAVSAGPGLRWAAMGPHTLFHLGAGEGGMAEFCARYRESFHRWWRDMGEVELTPEVVRLLTEGIAAAHNEPPAETAKRRDQLIIGMLKAKCGA